MEQPIDRLHAIASTLLRPHRLSILLRLCFLLVSTATTTEQHRRGGGHHTAICGQHADSLQQQLQRVAHGVAPSAAGVARVATGTARAAFKPRRRASRGAKGPEEGQRRSETGVVGRVEDAVGRVGLQERALCGLRRRLQGVRGEAHMVNWFSTVWRRHTGEAPLQPNGEKEKKAFVSLDQNFMLRITAIALPFVVAQHAWEVKLCDAQGDQLILGQRRLRCCL